MPETGHTCLLYPLKDALLFLSTCNSIGSVEYIPASPSIHACILAPYIVTLTATHQTSLKLVTLLRCPASSHAAVVFAAKPPVPLLLKMAMMPKPT